ncbi:PaaI family thioesterase [Natronorubrum halophilum]|uniref:PaaI family thioesterase n=1 Tax=Natronorubrum halophilum TaxID=1702106 RepID=UPI000EF74DA0|nr:PaaI family thioesterase [Natronorubrum halophilum]
MTVETVARDEAVQDLAWPEGTCHGCGPANSDGLQLKSYLSVTGDQLVATFGPDAIFNSGVPNIMYGGLVASLIDCQAMWTAIVSAHLAEDRPLTDDLILYVTGELNVGYRKPTPLDQPIHLRSWVEGKPGRKTRVTCELGPDDTVTAVGDILAVRVDG